ncbi:hypothetical protein BDR06DRAFT_946230 [Suillus hirtellus]|nr:hypothetical protein BDR06DRAFT_946230 [Suillus hirtellus]
MPLVSDDPSWWPTINACIVSSYFVGSWRVCWLMAVISQSNLGRGSTVAASVGVGYDWGERDGF